MNTREEMRDAILEAVYATLYKQMAIEQIRDKIKLDKNILEEQLEILEEGGYVELYRSDTIGIADIELTAKGKQRVMEGALPSNPTISYNVHTTIGEGNAGQINLVGIAQNASISQVTGDPQQLQTFVEEQCNKILDAVRTDLPARELKQYIATIDALREELLSENPDQNLLREHFGLASFLATAEGNIALIARVVPLLVPLIDAASKLVS